MLYNLQLKAVLMAENQYEGQHEAFFWYGASQITEKNPKAIYAM